MNTKDTEMDEEGTKGGRQGGKRWIQEIEKDLIGVQKGGTGMKWEGPNGLTTRD